MFFVVHVLSLSMPRCHNCLKRLDYTGPTGRGDPDVAVLLRLDGDTTFPFCSEACADWWWDLVGHTGYDHAEIAEVEP